MSPKYLRLPLVLLLLCARGALAAGPTDWPQFRGPQGLGHAPDADPPVEWTPAKNVVWKVDVPGAGWSSPIVSAGRIYLTTAVLEGGRLSLRALALDAGAGKTLWSREVFTEDARRLPNIHKKNSHASPTPLAAGDKVFVHYGHLGTACLDRDGKVVWRNQELRYPPVHGSGGSPALAGGLLIVHADGAEAPFVAALDVETGKVRWKKPRSVETSRTFSFSTPLLIEAAGRKQLLSPASGHLAAYDPASGEELWRVLYDGYSVVPQPSFGHGLVFFSSGFDAPEVYAVRPDGRGDVTASHVAWRLRRGAPNTPSPLLVGDELYLVSDKGVASCLDARTGKAHWQERIDGEFSASPILAGDRIYFFSEEGVGIVVRLGKEFVELGRSSLGERLLATPAVSGRALYIRTEKRLWKIEAKS